MGCGVMQVVLKEIAIVIRQTSKGNKVKIVARSFVVKTIGLNGMTPNFTVLVSGDITSGEMTFGLDLSGCVSSYKL